MSAKIPPIGTLRDKVQLQAKTISQDVAGGHEISYLPITSVWANVSSSNGREMVQADANNISVTHVVLLRFRNDLSLGDRIIYRNRTLEILSLNDLNGKRAYLKCFCLEIEVVG